jgi:hypothetical protein
MALLNAPFTVVTQIMPSFLLAVITGASIHLLAIFYKDFAIGFKPNKWMMGKLHLRGKKDRNNNYNSTRYHNGFSVG